MTGNLGGVDGSITRPSTDSDFAAAISRVEIRGEFAAEEASSVWRHRSSSVAQVLAAAVLLAGESGGASWRLHHSVNTYLDPSLHPRKVREIPLSELARAPFNAVLKLKAFDPATYGHHWLDCTAFAAEERHIVVTAAHCVIEKGELRSHAKLYTQYHDGRYSEAFDADVVWLGMTDWHKEPERDAAILYVRQGLPPSVQPLSLEGGALPRASSAIEAIGYSAHVEDGERPVHDPDCHLHREYEGAWRGHDMIFHDCSLTDVASGSPLLRREAAGGYAVVGIHVGERLGEGRRSQLDVPYGIDSSNFAVKAAVFAAEVRNIAQRAARGETLDALTSAP